MKFDDMIAKRRAAIYSVTDRMYEEGIGPESQEKEIWQEQVWERTKWLPKEFFEAVIECAERNLKNYKQRREHSLLN